MEREFPATNEAYVEVSAWVESELEKVDCPLKMVMQISMCLEEAFINVAHYAYGDKRGSAWVDFGYNDGVVTLRLRDKGIAFDPLAKDNPDISLSVEDRPVGGLGIYLVKEMMDNVVYQRVNGENVLEFSKKIR